MGMFQWAWIQYTSTFRCICAFKLLKSLLFSALHSEILGKVLMLIICLVLPVFVNTHWSWPLSLTCAEAPKPHVNSDNGRPWDSGNCCLSAQWKERLSYNGPPVGSVCKLLCAAAVWGLPSELHISVLISSAACFGRDQFIWRLSLFLSRWVSAFLAYCGSSEAARSPKKSSSLLRVHSAKVLTGKSHRLATAVSAVLATPPRSYFGLSRPGPYLYE